MTPSLRYLTLFSGIGAPEVAFGPLGWECVGQAEIDPAACAVLRHRFPGVPNLGDVSKITEAQIVELGRIDLIIGGFPCQDLSIAGKRKGLRDGEGKATRSGLFFEAMRIVRCARRRSGLRFLIVENVPGLYSNNSGRDFGAVVAEMVGAEFDVPRDGWQNSGAAVGPDGFVEWACLDAQYWGLAQRRERVFFVADFGDWTDRRPVLLIEDGMQGNPPTRGEAREAIAGTIGGSSQSGGFRTTDLDNSGAFDDERASAAAFGGNNTAGSIDVATAVRAKGGTGHGDFESETFIVAHALDAHSSGRVTEDGTGRGNPVVAFSCKDYGQDMQVDITPTLRAMNEVDGHANGGGQMAVAFKASHYTRGKDGAPSEVFPPLSADADKGDQDPLVFQTRIARNGRGQPSDVVPALTGVNAGDTSDMRPCVAAGGGVVRRLIPREYARLQGFPDDWHVVPYRNGTMKDGPAYKCYGNAMSVPVVRYIGERIALAMESELHHDVDNAASCGS